VRGLVRTIPRRAALAALAGLLSGVVFLALAAPQLAEAFASRLGGSIAVAGVVAVAVAVAVVALLSRAVTGPIGDLTGSAESVASGRSAHFEERGPDETRRLAEALRRMAETITGQRREAEAERDRLAVLIDELTDAIVIVDGSGQISRANRAATGIYGEPLPGRRIVEVIRDHEALEAISRARVDVDTVAHVERSAPPRFHRVVARRLAGGELLLVVQDLTNLRRLETVRRDFVANVSHELRTPLASLKVMVEALETGALRDPEAAADFVRRIRHETDGLAELVEDLLVLGRIESGQDRLAIEPTPPADLLASAADRMRALVERAGIRLVVEDGPGLPAVAADRDRVGQVFANLLHNATRHTAPGGEIRLHAAPADGTVAFVVRDTGDGIAADDLDRIFERFYKGDRSRASGGTGLGLSIARHIVEAHGGAISAQSEGPGRGATFTFTLPVARR
jgi:two-component system phosphate regulon sensor histidine kinase PhoR